MELSDNFLQKGTQASKEWFIGRVWVNMNINPTDVYNATIATVSFEPMARTNWHSHSKGQILFVIEGVGYYQEKGKPIQLIKKGEVIKIPKDVVHWHGASHGSEMKHIAIITEVNQDTTEWLQPVSDKEYNSINLN